MCGGGAGSAGALVHAGCMGPVPKLGIERVQFLPRERWAPCGAAVGVLLLQEAECPVISSAPCQDSLFPVPGMLQGCRVTKPAPGQDAAGLL